MWRGPFRRAGRPTRGYGGRHRRAGDLAQIAAKRSPHADIRVGDIEALPWPDNTFDVVTGFSSFQFADDHATALSEARRVSRGQVWVVIPTRLADSGIPHVFAALTTLFPPDALPSLKRSGMYALSTPGTLEEMLSTAGMSPRCDETIAATTVFPDTGAAVGAFLSAGATMLASRHSGHEDVEKALYDALAPFTGDHGTVTLPGWFRVVQTG